MSEQDRDSVYLVYAHNRLLWEVCASLDIAHDHAADYIGRAWPRAVLVQDWVNFNPSGSAPSWWQYWASPGENEPISINIRERVLRTTSVLPASEPAGREPLVDWALARKQAHKVGDAS